MLPVLLLLFYAAFTIAQQAPMCPNGQLPKMNSEGAPLQCLPGISKSCGANHACYFSGLNYMCCPNNEPSAENQPSCPSSSLTVLDSHGFPLKCSPRTRYCPEKTMYCSDVGIAFICCERKGPEPVKPTVAVTKAPTRRKKLRGTQPPEETLDCPGTSIGMLRGDGTRVTCNSKIKCPGTNSFCFGEYKRSICCERYEFAASILDIVEDSNTDSATIPTTTEATTTTVTTTTPIPGGFNVKIEKRVIDRTTPEEPVERMVHNNEMRRPLRVDSAESAVSGDSVVQTSSRIIKKRKRVQRPSTLAPIDDSAVTQHPLIVFTTPLPTISDGEVSSENSSRRYKKKKPENRAFGIRTLSEQPPHQPTPMLSQSHPSELFNSKDKKLLAQQFLMHQIRNGWPYDDRFYRPDMDAFSSDQRRDIAKLQFNDN